MIVHILTKKSVGQPSFIVRGGYDEPSTRLENTKGLFERSHIVADVFDDIKIENIVEFSVRKWHLCHTADHDSISFAKEASSGHDCVLRHVYAGIFDIL